MSQVLRATISSPRASAAGFRLYSFAREIYAYKIVDQSLDSTSIVHQMRGKLVFDQLTGDNFFDIDFRGEVDKYIISFGG